MMKLFYVEDDKALADVTCRALQKRGFDVDHFSSVASAEEALGAGIYSHALIDLKIGNDLSLDLIKPLRKRQPEINIILLTAYASIATAVQAVKLGADNYLSKPATISDILRAFANDENTLTAGASEEDMVMSVKRLEWEHIQRALAENNGNISATARQLKMHRRTLQRKLQKKPVSE